MATLALSTSSSSSYLVVAGIDFGTHGTGVSFAFTGRPDEIHTDQRFPGKNQLSSKTLTSVLCTRNSMELVAFGHAARDQYLQLDDSERTQFLLFEQFKMSLFADDCQSAAPSLASEIMIRAADGTPKPVQHVLALAMGFLKTHLLSLINSAPGCKVSAQQVQWVITVPAIWSNFAKQCMRLAAEQGGLCTSSNREQVLFALEPEAASLACRRDLQQMGRPVAGGTKYLVFDCGGGTVDVTAHMLSSDGKSVHEILAPSGGPWGSCYINVNYERLMQDIFSYKLVTDFKVENPAAFVDGMEKFERSKSQFVSNDVKRIIELNQEFAQFIESRAHSSVSKLVKDYSISIGSEDEIKSSNGRIIMQRAAFLKLFEPVVSKIAAHLQRLLGLSALSGCSQVFLVGGFGESPILLNALLPIARAAGADIFVPLSSSLAVMKGAVQYGLQPDVILDRCSRFTLGINASPLCRDGDPAALQFVDDEGLRRTKNRFSIFVARNQRIPQSFKVERIFDKSNKSQVAIEFEIFSSHLIDPQFVTDAGCTRLTSVNFPMPEQSSKSANVAFFFGGTEIKITITECTHPSNVLALSIKFEQIPYHQDV